MIKNTIYTLFLGGFFLISAGLLINSSVNENILKTINVKIEKDNTSDIWRVRDNEGNNRGTLRVNKKDKINWQAMGSDMIFTFSKDVDRYFDYSDEMFEDGKSQEISKNNKLRVTLKDNAPKDTLVYEVYVVEADTFVIGDSPPKLVIN